jgi:MtN3 and saliva related transmembrane protein
MDISQILGWTATILFSSMVIPQIVKTIKTKDTKGISIHMFAVYFIANLIALIYAFTIVQTPLKIKYSLGIITSVFYIGLFFYYKSKYK